MSNIFKDINFKFAVIAILNEKGFYIEEAEEIKLNKSYSRQYLEADDYSIVEEVYTYYKNLKIPQDKLDMITIFNPSVSAECYNLLVKEWGGEDDMFDITSLDGIQLLHNLESFEPSYLLQEDGADISGLLKCSNLKKVVTQAIPNTPETVKVLEQLKQKGIIIVEEE